MLEALSDLRRSLVSWRLWTLLGWLEIRQRYARSRVGPFWLTISMSVIIGTIGIVYGTLFGQTMSDYLPYLAASLVLWGLFSGIVTEGSTAYISNSAYIRQVATSRLIYILQVTWRNVVIFTHNAAIIVLLLAIFGIQRWDTLPLFLPGLLLLVVNATWIGIVTALVSARFRDFPQIVASIVQMAFYLTPIMYKAELLTKYSFITTYNPMLYLLDVARMPLLGQVPSARTYVITITLALVGWIFALWLTGRYTKRISYWI